MRRSLPFFIAALGLVLLTGAIPINQALQLARQNVIELRQSESPDQAYWNLPSYLGTHYIAQYSLVLAWLGDSVAGEKSALDRNHLKQLLLGTQLPDGSWYAVEDANIPSGDINATVFNYWALKAMGVDPSSPPLAAARKFILSKGGLKNTNMFCKIFLALFHNHSWNGIQSIPYFIFSDWSPVSDRDFAQWIGPHLMPIAYLRGLHVSRDLGPAYNLDELWADGETSSALPAVDDRPQPGSSDATLIKTILKLQQPKGSWGGYTVSSLLTLMAFDDFSLARVEARASLLAASSKAFAFLEKMYFKSGSGAYRGVLDDGRYWDTALLGIAAAEAGTPPAALKSSVDYLVSRQSKNGGFAFGEDFEYKPDTDDTAEILIFLSRFRALPEYRNSINSALGWLLNMQNNDGGWGAFDRNNKGGPILEALTHSFSDSADLFDESTADVTGHILEALGTFGYTLANSEAAHAGAAFLRESQDPATGTWEGRWGINRIYGTGAAVVGLIKVGEDPQSAVIRKAVDWLLSVQNRDGGFGESSLSYKDPGQFGRGISTPSQTAWAMLALLAADPRHASAASDQVLDRAAEYLVKEFGAHGRWMDLSTVGTGHPGLIYMNYPSYPYSFPLVALARYREGRRMK